MNMNWQSFLAGKGMLPLALALELAIITVLPTQALAFPLPSQKAVSRPEVDKLAEYRPPQGLGAPPSTGGGTRSGGCSQDKENKDSSLSLTALMPALTSKAEWGLTVEAQPQFFVYLPQTSARTAEFVLKDENENDVYRKTFPIYGDPEIVNISLPTTVPPLEIHKNYHWYFSIICNPGNRRRDVFVDGWSRRTELNSNLAAQIQKADPRDRPNLYAQAGIWHEALSTLADLRREAPNDPKLAAEWKKLLESAGLKQIADLPIILIASESYP